MKILLQPSSEKEAMKHFTDTIESGVSVDLLKDKIKPEEYEKLKELNQEKVKIWGLVPRLEGKERSEWRDLKENDLILFYKEKRFFYTARVHSKIHNQKLAEELWGLDKKGKTWEYIYFIKEGQDMAVPYDPTILKKKDGSEYKENHVIQGAVLLDNENSENLSSYLEIGHNPLLDENLTEPSDTENIDIGNKAINLKTPEQAEEEISKLSIELLNKPVKEKIRTAKALARNPKIARLVKERVKYVCEVCGVKPFIKRNGELYAEAHHRLELAKSKLDNQKDMICVCPPCHRVIHYGNENSLESRKGFKKK